MTAVPKLHITKTVFKHASWVAKFAQTLRKPQTERVQAEQMETAERQVDMRAQTDGCMKCGTCFWRWMMSPTAWFGVEKITGESFIFQGL